MRNLPSFMNDTKHALQLIEEINEKVDKNELSLDGVGLATLDLVQMYNNMTEEVGIRACQNYLEGKDSNGVDEDEDYVSSESILKALRICIQNNFFQFNGEIFHQKKGVGTGMKLAPPFACLGVGELEKQFFNSNHDNVKIIQMWKRFIDDIFALIKGSEEQCIALVNYLNTLMPGVVKFTYSYSTEKVVFLDLEISLVDGKIETNLYIKPSNSQIYLDYHSNHPEHTKSSIPYSQALRVIVF